MGRVRPGCLTRGTPIKPLLSLDNLHHAPYAYALKEGTAYINVRFPADQKEYLDKWAKENYWQTGSLARLLIADAIVAHAARAGVNPPQSLVDDPPRVKG
jgi:non-ribosomal peptide synthetase component F